MDECVAVVFQNQRARVFLKLSELFLASAYFLSNLWIWVVSAASQRHVGVKVFYVEQKHAVLRNSVVWPLAFAGKLLLKFVGIVHRVQVVLEQQFAGGGGNCCRHA